MQKRNSSSAAGFRIRVDKKQLAIISPDQAGKIVDVFAGKEYLFTATVNESGEIHLGKEQHDCTGNVKAIQRRGHDPAETGMIPHPVKFLIGVLILERI